MRNHFRSVGNAFLVLIALSSPTTADDIFQKLKKAIIPAPIPQVVKAVEDARKKPPPPPPVKPAPNTENQISLNPDCIGSSKQFPDRSALVFNTKPKDWPFKPGDDISANGSIPPDLCGLDQGVYSGVTTMRGRLYSIKENTVNGISQYLIFIQTGV
jgi:hypothetical protein